MGWVDRILKELPEVTADGKQVALHAYNYAMENLIRDCKESVPPEVIEAIIMGCAEARVIVDGLRVRVE